VNIVLLVPSRGRPARARAMYDSVLATAIEDVDVRFLVDADDPEREEYQASGVPMAVMTERIGYTASLNLAARLRWDDAEILGAFGDDVLFRTVGWDLAVREALREPGIAYGNDLVHAAGHPTAVWMSSSIAKALGWLALPYSWHLWVDDAWKALGAASGTLRYLPEDIVEHMHPAVGKAELDDTYRSVYDGDRAHRDHIGFVGWRELDLERDAGIVREVAEGA